MTRSVAPLSLAIILLSASCSTPFARVHYTRGKALFDDIAAKDPGNRDFNKAIEEFNRAIRLKPDYVDAYHVRGLAYLITGNHARALEDLDEATYDEIEEIEAEVLDQATAARTIEELKAEIETLKNLESIAQ